MRMRVQLPRSVQAILLVLLWSAWFAGFALLPSLLPPPIDYGFGTSNSRIESLFRQTLGFIAILLIYLSLRTLIDAITMPMGLLVEHLVRHCKAAMARRNENRWSPPKTPMTHDDQ